MFGWKKKFERIVVPYYYNWFFKSRNLKRIQSQDQITVLFFVINVGMWKYDGFFRLLMEDPRFRPIIVPLLYPDDKEDYRRYIQDNMKAFFTAKGYTYYDAYDFGTRKYLNVKRLKPDIVFYAQPYDGGIEAYRARAFLHRCLFAYIPYCYNMEDDALFYKNLLHDIAWRLYYPTEHHARMVAHYSRFGAKNVVISGYPMADRLLSTAPIEANIWKENDSAIKRVIWAPHHSILPNDLLDYSHFLELAEGMLELAQKYKGKIQFAFKPHPRLKPKLQKIASWGVERTEAYYKRWDTMPNTVFVEGDYVDLFRSSDALLHDCSSFMGEYMFVDKPVLFLAEKTAVSARINDFGKDCLKYHYQALTISEIEKFLEEVVLEGKDTQAHDRHAFRQQLTVEGSVAQRMYEDFKSGLEKPQ